MLGLGHEPGSKLTSTHHVGDNQACIDQATFAALAANRKLPLSSFNWCEGYDQPSRRRLAGAPESSPPSTAEAARWMAGSPAARTDPSELMSSSPPCQSVISPPAPLTTGTRAAKS